MEIDIVTEGKKYRYKQICMLDGATAVRPFTFTSVFAA